MPVPPYRVKVADKEGRSLPRGHTGECLVKGPGLTSGYWNDTDSDRSLFTDDGWLRTGDLAQRTRLGLIRIVGRTKEVIKCGGYSVYARDVEEVLAAHPAVAVAVVVGVPHPRKGEMPVAVVEPTVGEGTASQQDLAQWCLARLAPYQCPRRIHVVSPGELPRGETEKVLNRLLRERYRDEFHRDEDGDA